MIVIDSMMLCSIVELPAYKKKFFIPHTFILCGYNYAWVIYTKSMGKSKSIINS